MDPVQDQFCSCATRCNQRQLHIHLLARRNSMVQVRGWWSISALNFLQKSNGHIPLIYIGSSTYNVCLWSNVLNIPPLFKKTHFLVAFIFYECSPQVDCRVLHGLCKHVDNICKEPCWPITCSRSWWGRTCIHVLQRELQQCLELMMIPHILFLFMDVIYIVHVGCQN